MYIGRPRAIHRSRKVRVPKQIVLPVAHRMLAADEQQRVGIARAFITQPEVVFADEPTGNLDTRTTKEVMHMIRGFAHRFHQTIVLVSHDPEMTEYADRIVTLIDGRIVSNVENQVKAEIDAAPYIE